MVQPSSYPLTFAVDYPDRKLNRLTTFFRIFTVIPIAIVAGSLAGGDWSYSRFDSDQFSSGSSASFGTAGLLFVPPLLMILFRQKYPGWWADWNRQLLRFINRITIYVLLMDDRYPSTDEEQSVKLDFPQPDGARLNRWLPLVKWLLALPHYIILFFLVIFAAVCVFLAWFAILFTGRYPRSLFEFVEGVVRWHNRVAAYALILITDEYPPFSMSP